MRRKKKIGGFGSLLDPDETPALPVCTSCGSMETDVGRLELSVFLRRLRGFESDTQPHAHAQCGLDSLSVDLTFAPSPLFIYLLFRAKSKPLLWNSFELHSP